MSWTHVAERKVNDCTIVQYEDVDGFFEYEVIGPNGEHLGWYDNDDDAEAEAVTR